MRTISCKIVGLIFLFLGYACTFPDKSNQANEQIIALNTPSLLVLGTLQDGGSPHAGCKKDCCKNLFTRPDPARKVVSLGLIDTQNKQSWLFEATPDIASQMKTLKQFAGAENETPNGIFLTHAHIGHYAGLMYLGREAMNAKNVDVYAMPRMKSFLETNGPWSQLIKLKNINVKQLPDTGFVQLSLAFKVKPFCVPHRDEFSETAGYVIEGPHKKVLFIPDIDKWEKWSSNIIDEIKKVDYAFIDATFFSGEEINTRNIKEIPHPFVIESMALFKELNVEQKHKIYFIHFNHTNPLLNNNSSQSRQVLNQGFNIAMANLKIEM